MEGLETPFPAREARQGGGIDPPRGGRHPPGRAGPDRHPRGVEDLDRGNRVPLGRAAAAPVSRPVSSLASTREKACGHRHGPGPHLPTAGDSLLHPLPSPSTTP